MAETKWLGKYRAIVMDNNDPERRGRIRVQCPTVLGDYLSSWCEPCIPYATDYAGDYYVPPVNEAIWVEFEEGDVDKPIWGGGWYKIDSSPLTKDSNPEDYRYITFKNSVLRMGEREFIFELRDSDNSYVVRIDTSTWFGLNYIGSKTESELTDLELVIANKSFLLDTFPNEIREKIATLETEITDVANTFNGFLEESYNPFVQDVSDEMSQITSDLQNISGKITEIDSNLQDLQNQVNSLNETVEEINDVQTKLIYYLNKVINEQIIATVNLNADTFNFTVKSLADNADFEFTYAYMENVQGNFPLITRGGEL